MIRKIFPFDAESSFFNSFKIVFLSEGYLATESALFISSCIEFVDRLLETPPFNLTRINSNWLSIYTSFTASNNRGPSIDIQPSPNRTAFESQVISVSSQISINQQKLNSYLDLETFIIEDSIQNLQDYVEKGWPNIWKTGTLFVVLLPELSVHLEGAEFENSPSDNDYYYVATTQNGEWQQVIIRSLCKLLGLGDEFELDGQNFLEPKDKDILDLLYYPNIQYFDPPPLTINPTSVWHNLFSVTQQELPIEIHSKIGSPATSDNSINDNLTYYSKPAYWEGAGSYRTKVYRSAEDCLLRRRIGDSLLLVRKQKVGFCPACIHYLKTLIT